MDEGTAILLQDISKTFTINVEDHSKRSSIFNSIPTKKVDHTVIDHISLSIKKGEIIGIVGRNGSGKSTLLSLISKILVPDSGELVVNGKVAAILELGMGFHQDLSGRENIYLKGELYGFSKKEMDDKLESIIEYSGIAEYIDNPVRTYSSGMSGRLAFAIMIHVQSDIMVVDEVLSVGDVSFETKAKEHFKSIAKSGKTVIIASHQINLIEQLCTRVLWLDKGKIRMDGDPQHVLRLYSNEMRDSPEVIVDLAKSGVPDAQYKLAVMYRDGVNFEQNKEMYLYWLKLSAENNHARAQVEWGDWLCSIDQGEKAIDYYQSAVQLGFEEAKVKLAMIVSPNEVVEELKRIFGQVAFAGDSTDKYRYAELLLKTSLNQQDREESFNEFLESAKSGSAEAYYQLAIMCRDGVGTKRDYSRMEQYLQTAHDLGNVRATTLLAELYQQGRLLPKNDQKSFELYMATAKCGVPNGAFRVAYMYREGLGVSKDLNQSKLWSDDFFRCTLHNHILWAADLVASGAVKSDYDYKLLCEYKSDPGSVKQIDKLLALKCVCDEPIEEQLSELESLSKTNNIEAMRKLGNIYYSGSGVTRNYVKALNWFEKCAKLGDGWSKVRCGEMYRDGVGTSIDLSKSIQYFLEAAKMNNISAINAIVNLGVTGQCESGTVVKTALDQLESLAKVGNIEALRKIGSYYYIGFSVEQDYSKALYWFEKCAKLGDDWSRIRCGEMYRDGVGTKPDFARAEEYFWSALSYTSLTPINNLLNLYSKDSSPNSIKIKQVIRIMEQQATSGNMDAIRKLGNYYAEGIFVEKDPSQALIWYKKASIMGDRASQLTLAEMYRNGIGTKVDTIEAAKWYYESVANQFATPLGHIIYMYHTNLLTDRFWYDKAISKMEDLALHNNVEAMRRLGNLYSEGKVLNKDMNLALMWYHKAADLGDRQSQDKIKQIKL